jgi:hypothetical protein
MNVLPSLPFLLDCLLENGGRGASIDRPASSVVDIDVNPSQRDLKIGKAG